MHTCVAGPILLVCADQDRAFEILDKLYAEGFSAVGPAPTAGLALTLTAQTMPRTAIIAGQTTGRRTAADLAAELARTWGVECFVLGDDLGAGHTALRDPSGAGPMATLRRALGQEALRRPSAA